MFWFVVAVVVILWLLGRPFYWKGKGIGNTVPLPLVGSWPGGGMIGLSRRKYDGFPRDSLVGLHIGPRPVLMMRSPALINLALSVYSEHFNSHGLPAHQDVDQYSSGVFTVDGQQWREVRSKMSPQFTPARIKAVFGPSNKTVDRLISRLREEMGKPLEVRELLLRFQIDATSSALFGLESDAMTCEDSSLFKYIKDTFKPSLTVRVMTGVVLPSVHKFLGLGFLTPQLAEFFGEFSRKLIQEREAQGGGDHKDFLQLLIDLKKAEKDPDNSHVSYYQDGTRVPKYTSWTLPAHMMTMFNGAVETSATTMSFCLYELAVNREIQEKARKEAIEVIHEHGEHVPYQALAQLTYINMIVAETLRKYPVFHVFFRQCTKAFLVPDTNVVIDEGTPIMIPTYSIHHDPQYYPDPEEFRPERFTEEEKAKRSQGTYLPFGIGPRTCLGMRLSLAQMSLVVCRLLYAFRLELCKESDHPVTLSKTDFLTTPAKGIWLSAVPL